MVSPRHGLPPAELVHSVRRFFSGTCLVGRLALHCARRLHQVQGIKARDTTNPSTQASSSEPRASRESVPLCLPSRSVPATVHRSRRRCKLLGVLVRPKLSWHASKHWRRQNLLVEIPAIDIRSLSRLPETFGWRSGDVGEDRLHFAMPKEK